MTIRLGPLSIDPVEYGSRGSAVLGIRDSGKTYTATLLAERLFEAGIPFIAFDPIGVWRFLRMPGKGRGYPVVVAGGQDGDLALSPASAPAIVEAAMQNGISLVVDLFSIDLSKADWKRIVRDSVRLLLHRNQAHGLRHVFIEEAAEFAPQRVIDGEVYAEIEKLARMGGNARLGYTLINQRAEEVNKAVLELCDNLFLHRQKGRNSLQALAKWLDVGNVRDAKAVTDSLSTLPTGECWAWLHGTDHAVRIKVPAKNSLHPDRRVMHGDDKALKRAAVDVGTFVEQMRGALPKIEEEAKASHVPTLRKRIAELERELAKKPAAERIDATAVQIDEALRRGRASARAGVANAMATRFVGLRAEIDAALDRMREQLLASLEPEPIGGGAPAPPNKALTGMKEAVAHARAGAPTTRTVAVPRPAASGSGESLPKAERLILTVLAQRHPERVPVERIAAIAGYSVTGGGFRNAMGSLRTKGLIEPGDTPNAITAEGLAALGSFDPLPSGPALLEHWRDRLPKAESLILGALGESSGELSVEAIATATGYEASGGGFRNALGKLRTLGLITGRGTITLHEDLR